MPPKTDKKPAAEPEVKGPSEAEIRQSNMVASTFANVELHTTKTTLAQYVALYNSCREEVMRLQQDLEERDKDAMTVVQFLRGDLDARQEQIKELKKKSAEDLKAAEEKSAEIQANLIGTIRDRDDTIAEMQATIDGLTADLDALHAFKRNREEMHIQLSKLKDDHEKMIEHYEAELSKQRFLSLEEKVRLKAEERSMEEKFEAEVHDRAMKLLDSKTKEINAENFMLLSDKATLERELSKAMEAYQRVNSRAEEQQRECDLAKLADGEHVKRSVAKGREARELQQRCTELEANLAKVVKEHQEQIKTLTGNFESRMTTLAKERDDALKTAELIQRDYLKMRQLTKSVVKQRTDLETFFNEALDFVRNEIDRERKAAAIAQRQANLEALGAPSSHAVPRITASGSTALVRGAAARASRRGEAADVNAQAGRSQSTSLPPIGTPTNSKAPLASSTSEQSQHQDPADAMLTVPRVDISDLSWSDKERVLRILFAKINSVSGAKAAMATSGPGAASTRLPAIENRGATADSSAVFMTSAH